MNKNIKIVKELTKLTKNTIVKQKDNIHKNKYKKTHKILTAITTYDAYAYVDFNLTSLKRFNNNSDDFIVCDDCSESKQLKDVCNKHNVKLLTLQHKAQCNDIGDLSLVKIAFQYAYEHGYDYLLKISRTFVLLDNPYESLNYLINETGGYTYSNRVIRWDYGFNTACICYNVKEYYKRINKIQQQIQEMKTIPFYIHLRVETFMHNLAKQIQPKSIKYKKYKKIYFSQPHSDGYITWDWIGCQQKKVPYYILWHDDSNPMDYWNYSKLFGLKYEVDDFYKL